MISYRITLGLGSQMDMSAGINAKLFPLMNQAVNAVAQATAENWRQAVYRAKLWSGEKDAYAGSISYRMTGEFSATIEATYKHAVEIETGRPQRDLKKMLDTSMKVRRTKDGTRFLIIPFRHNVKSMPQDVRTAAKALTPSSIVGRGQRRAGEIVSARVGMGMLPLGEKRQRQSPFASDLKTKKAAMVERRDYSWGGRLEGANVPRNMQGMVRMNNSTPGQNRSSYLTFRVMSEKSRGWIIPAQPGQFIAQKVAADMQPKAEAAFAEAVRRSLS